MWITSNLQTHIKGADIIVTKHTIKYVSLFSLLPTHQILCYWRLNSRDIQSYGHGWAEKDDVAPVDEEPGVGCIAVDHQSRQNPPLAHDPTRKQTTANGKEQSCQQHTQDNLEIQNTGTVSITSTWDASYLSSPCPLPTHPDDHFVENFLHLSLLHPQFLTVPQNLSVCACHKTNNHQLPSLQQPHRPSQKTILQQEGESSSPCVSKPLLTSPWAIHRILSSPKGCLTPVLRSG